MLNLDEAVITFSKQGINFSNNFGDKILSNIYKKVFNNNDELQFIKNINLQMKTKVQNENENLIINKQIFEVLNESTNI